MTLESDGGGPPLPSLSRHLSPAEVTMDLTMCGLLVDRAEQLVRLYADRGNWNDVEEVWFGDRVANRSTRGSARKIYRVLSSRFKNASTALPNPGTLPGVLEQCRTTQEKAQILYLYLIGDDALVRYVVHEYVNRLSGGTQGPIDFSNATLSSLLERLEYSDGSGFDYADSTTDRWCEGFRSVMREIGVLEGQQSSVGEPPSIGDVPLLVMMDYSYGVDDETWLTEPRGLRSLFQPERRWEELFDRAAGTDAWEYLELHGELDLRPTGEPYSWVRDGRTA